MLLQSEFGDLYKLSMQLDDNKNVKSISIKFFDSVPVSTGISILKSGFLFVAAEVGNQ